jgi:uncharacterized membrane protein (UPF0136 family)
MALPQVLERRVAVAQANGRRSRRLVVWESAAQHALFAVAPVVFTLWMIKYSIDHGSLALDFHHEFWPGAHRLLEGLGVYDRSWMNLSGGVAFPYPALTAVGFVPFALMSRSAADGLITALDLSAILLALWVLRVRDWRLYGLALILWPVVQAWQSANLTLILALGMAWLWRRRDHPLAAGALVAVLISLKPFVWPLALWLLVTRRYRALAYASVCGLALNAVVWGIVGFSQIHAYTSLTSALNDIQDRRGYSIFSLVMHLGAGRGLAYAVGLTAVATLAAACLVVGRRGNARAALTLCVAECLLATPVLWTHYFALLIVPLALYRPRLDSVWLAMLLFYACPGDSPKLWQMAFALLITAVIVAWLLLVRDEPTAAPGVGWARLAARRGRSLTTHGLDGGT